MLKLTNVEKSFTEPDGTRLPVLAVANFSLAAAEQAVLLGESGSGKTTLLHVIAGITRPDRGCVEVDGRDITRMPESVCDRYRAAKIGYVFQTFNLLPGFSALENVLLGMTFGQGRANPARARELLDRVGLSHRLTHKPGTMSVGEQQRVAVARALANRPRLLLADEPTANVDRGNQQHIIELIGQQCRAEDVALLIVTHAGEVAEQFDRVENLSNFNEVRVPAE
jgi:putative ABC transport system ATP-binding protein